MRGRVNISQTLESKRGPCKSTINIAWRMMAALQGRFDAVEEQKTQLLEEIRQAAAGRRALERDPNDRQDAAAFLEAVAGRSS